MPKISELPAAATITGTETVPVVQAGAAVKATVTAILAGASVIDATTLVKGKVRLAGDLGGTADAPTVPGLATGLALKANDNAVVKLTGAQTKSGVLTLSDIPVVPNDSFPIAKTIGLQTALNAKATDANVIKTTGAQTKAGVLTLSDAPVLTAGALPIAATNGLQVALDATVKLTGAQTKAGVLTLSDIPVVPNDSFTIAKTIGLQTALDAKALDSAVVKLTGAQSKAGVLTLTDIPVVPDDSFPIAKTIGLQTALNALAPWTVDIDALQSVANTGWNSPTASAVLYGGYNISSGAQNDEIAWDVVLSAGTWTIQICHYTSALVGIYSVRVDGVEVGTLDGYVDPGAANQHATITGVVVATAGKRQVKLKMATKNASSAQYFGAVQHVQLRRTA